MENKIRFKPYEYNWIDEDGKQYSVSLIALTHNGNVIKLTDYHKYIGDCKKSRHLYNQNKDSVRRVCNFLNYVLFENYFIYRVKNVGAIPFEAVQNYITYYASTKNRFNEYPSAQSVEKERNAVCLFMANLPVAKRDKHYYARKVVIHSKDGIPTSLVRRQKYSNKWEYEIPVRYLGEHGYKLVRDIPQKAIAVLLKWIGLKAPDLYFAALLQLCAGLREGEVVNVRRADSKYCGGIRYSKENGRMTSFEIDLRTNYQLRSDGKSVGRIKRPRKQEVYPVFLPLIQEAYLQHLNLMKLKRIEDSAPMFVDNRLNHETGYNMAITKQNYCKRIKRITEQYVVPELLKLDDIELQTFSMMVNENSWGLHAFRHWFTVQLVLNNEDANGIAYWRGDTSTKTAFSYLQNKGELKKKYTMITEKMSSELMDVVSEMEGVNGGNDNI